MNEIARPWICLSMNLVELHAHSKLVDRDGFEPPSLLESFQELYRMVSIFSPHAARISIPNTELPAHKLWWRMSDLNRPEFLIANEVTTPSSPIPRKLVSLR